MDTAIVVEGLTKQFDGFTAVDHIHFSVAPGEVFGYLGPNGSGKTTTIRMLLGLLRPSAGTGQVLGLDIERDAEKIRPQVGYMSQKFALYNDLDAVQNLNFYAGVYGVADRAARVQEVLELVGLREQAQARTGQLSAGWRQRLALGASLLHRPQLIFLDEPTSGVDPQARRAFWDLVYDLADQGVTIFVTTHYMDEAEYCDRLGIMFQGQLLALDTPANLKRTTLNGTIWEVAVTPQLPVLAALEKQPDIQRVSLAGDRLRVVADGHTAVSLQQLLAGWGFEGTVVSPTDPTLEDVFITLAAR
ncbi:MAG: ABC transporter ATP-binding protein [Anaerolineae bacterium]|nr:ABC transporter ATP-binding protein [Anaerolineae bacterium]